MLYSLVSLTLRTSFLYSISVCLVCGESMLIPKCFLACYRKERVFQEFWEQANCLEVLLEMLLGSCIENNKKFMYLLKIGHSSKVYLVGCGGDAYIHVLCLTVLSVCITSHRLCAWRSLLTTEDKMFPALRNLQPRWTLQKDRKSSSSSRWKSLF